ncbi:MAG: hypothetical protein ACYDDS_19030 [Candidatus Sulfotelmatobacter sp.]
MSAATATQKQIERSTFRARLQEVKIVVCPNTGAWTLKRVEQAKG